jgi:hypothetical protein
MHYEHLDIWKGHESKKKPEKPAILFICERVAVVAEQPTVF